MSDFSFAFWSVLYTRPQQTAAVLPESGFLALQQLGSIGAVLAKCNAGDSSERLCNVDQFCRNTSSIIVIWGLSTFQTWALAP